MCVPMVAHFCKSGVIRPGTCALWCILYFTKVAKDISSPTFSPFFYLYSFPERIYACTSKYPCFSCTLWGFPKWSHCLGWERAQGCLVLRQPLSRGCRQTVLLRWIYLWFQSGCAGLNQGWCVPGCPSVWQRRWLVLNLLMSQHTKQGVEVTGAQPPTDTSSLPHLLVCTELRRTQPELAASHNDWDRKSVV